MKPAASISWKPNALCAGTTVSFADRRYSDRSAFNGEIELARSAGTMDAISAAHASTATATRVTAGLNGLVP